MKKICIVVIALLALFHTACKDSLDLYPETDLSDVSMWNNAGDFEKGVNKFYEWLPKIMDNNDGGAAENTRYGIADRDKLADIVIDNGTLNNISNSTYNIPATDQFYEGYYKRLRAINFVFKNAEGYAKPDEIKQYLAEAKFFRAYYSFLFFADFGPGTIVKGVLETEAPELSSVRNTRDEFADFIIADLESAIADLPTQTALPAAQNGRISKGTAQSMLARVALFEGTWQKYHLTNVTRANALFDKAIANSEAVMNDASYQLFYDARMGAESYRWMFVLESSLQTNPYKLTKAANKEYIFRNRFDENIRVSNQNVVHTMPGAGVTASRKMQEMYLTADGKIAVPDYKTSLNSFLKNRDPRLADNHRAVLDLYWEYALGRGDWAGGKVDSLRASVRSYDGVGFFNKKFASERLFTNATLDGMDVPIIRLAEMYLTYAEAKFEKNGTITNAELDLSINKLRTRVQMPALTNTTIPAGSDMKTEIRRERTVELWLEGHRYNDLRRWKTAETEMSQDLDGLPFMEGSAYLRTASVFVPKDNKTVTYTNTYTTNKGVVNAAGFALREAGSGRKFSAKHYLKPIPSKQIEINPNLKQNEGW
jgi:hypothetical protein